MFAQNLLKLKFVEILLHFWEGFFSCYKGKSLHKIW